MFDEDLIICWLKDMDPALKLVYFPPSSKNCGSGRSPGSATLPVKTVAFN
jgi:hypothetical protein